LAVELLRERKNGLAEGAVMKKEALQENTAPGELEGAVEGREMKDEAKQKRDCPWRTGIIQ